MIITLETARATEDFGAQLGKQLQAGDLVILNGSLGAGKTTLAKGIATGMGVIGRVTSPTFVIARVHRPAAHAGPGTDAPTGPERRRVPLVHVDAYRLTGAVELDDLDLDTDLDTAAVVVEWGAGVAEQLSQQRLTIELDRLPDDTRVAQLSAVGASWRARLPEIAAAWGALVSDQPAR